MEQLTVLTGLVICSVVTLTILVIGSTSSCCSAGLPLLVLHENAGTRSASCFSYPYCSLNKYISDASLILDNISNMSTEALIPPSFSTSITKHNSTSVGVITILAFFTPEKRLELVELLSNTFVALTQYYHWMHMIIFSDAADEFYLRTGETVYRNLSSNNSYSIQYVQINSQINEIDILNEIALTNTKIIFLSLTSQKVKKMLGLKAREKLKWPEYAWIIHSTDSYKLDSEILEGVIEVQAEQMNCSMSSLPNSYSGRLCRTFYPSLMAELVDIFLWDNQNRTHLFNYTITDGLDAVNLRLEVPSDISIKSTPSVFISLYYLGIFICFVLVSCTLGLYIYFRNESAIKATSTSLSILILIGCYILIFYLLILNSTLLPSYPRLSSSTRNFICVFRVWLHGIGYPVVLIMSVVIVKLFRIYRIFHCQGKINVHFSGNLALAVYALLLTSPNAMICLVWCTSDPYLSEVIITTRNGYLVMTEQCQSQHTIQWLVGLLLHNIILAVVLIIAAVMTRKIKLLDFKDTKKVNAFSFWFLVTMAIGLSYWYILRSINADALLVHAVLQLSHYSLIGQCLAFLFLPKLYPILKKRWMRRCEIPKRKF